MLKVSDQNTESCIYLAGFLPMFIFFFLQSSMFNQILSLKKAIPLMLTVLILLFKIFILDKFTFREWLFGSALLLITSVVFIKTGDIQLFVLALCIFASKNIKASWLVWAYMIVGIVLLLLIIYSAQMGIIQNLTYMRGTILRHALGSVYPTDFASRIFYFCCGYIYLRGNTKYRVFDFFLLLFVASLVFRETDARLNTILILLLAIMTILKRSIKKIVQKWMWLIPLVCFSITYIGSIFYNPNNLIFSIFNTLFSNRFFIVNRVFQEYGVSFWGQKILETGLGGSGATLMRGTYGYVYIDSAYMRLLLIFGACATIIFLGLFSLIMKNTQDPTLIVILIVIFISGIIEEHFINISFNIFFIIATAKWISNTNEFNKINLRRVGKR